MIKMIMIKNLMRHNTDKVERGLMVLFFSHVFSVAPIPPENFSATLVYLCSTKLSLV